MQLSQQEHVLPKAPVPGANPSKPVIQKEDKSKEDQEIKKLLDEAAAEDRVRALEEGVVSDPDKCYVCQRPKMFSLQKRKCPISPKLDKMPKNVS